MVCLVSIASCSGPNVGSVGAVLSVDRAREALVVREAPGDMSGTLEGLREGDVILSIDGNDVRGLDGKAVTAMLRGDVGTEVRLTVERKGEIERLRVIRGPFKRRAQP
jgi:carboxyl-terminal processing protease